MAKGHLREDEDEGDATERHVRRFNTVVSYPLEHPPRREWHACCHSAREPAVEHAHTYHHKNACKQSSSRLSNHNTGLLGSESFLLDLKLSLFGFLLIHSQSSNAVLHLLLEGLDTLLQICHLLHSLFIFIMTVNDQPADKLSRHAHQ